MSTPFDNKILHILWKSTDLRGMTIAALASMIKTRTPNAKGIMVRAVQGINWQGNLEFDIMTGGISRDPKRIVGPLSIRNWVNAFAQEDLDVHLIGVPQGINLSLELQLYQQALAVEGVKSLTLNITPRTWLSTNPGTGTNFMHALRETLPDTHIAISIDPRKNRDWRIYVDPFVPFVDSIQPTVFPIRFGRSIADVFTETNQNLASFNKPLAPILQAFIEVGNGPTPTEVLAQGNAAWQNNAVGISYFRLGTAFMTDAMLTAIGQVPVPQPTDPTPVNPFTWQDVINAFAIYCSNHDIEYGDWLVLTGLADTINSGINRLDPYSGPPIASLPNIPTIPKAEIQQLIDDNDANELIAKAKAALDAFERRKEQNNPTPPPAPPPVIPTGKVIGIHGAPGTAAPRPDTWETWITHLKEMGIRWYKQADDGSDDTGPHSTFRWVMRLKQEGITPIIRYMQREQFPHRLHDNYFNKMRLYAANGIHWAEIGNEPNLGVEWRKDIFHLPNGHPSHFDANTIQAIAESWLLDAERALNVGVRPAFYAFAPTAVGPQAGQPTWSSLRFTEKVITHLAQHHRQRTVDIFRQGGWLAVHTATYGRPVDYSHVRPDGRIEDMNLNGWKVPVEELEKQLGLTNLVIMSTEGGAFTKDSNSLHGHPRPISHEVHGDEALAMYEYIETQTPIIAMCAWTLSVGDKIGITNPEFREDGFIHQADDGSLRPRPVVRKLKALHQRRTQSRVTIE